MKSFEEFYQSILELRKLAQENNIHVKIEEELDFQIVKIFGENISALARAKSGLSDVEELAFTTAEHHPYWNLLYQCSQISKTTLEKWEDELTKEEIEEFEWSLDELKNACKKLKEHLMEKSGV